MKPYAILVSEVMLQQTQVDRVVPYYQNFLKRFPNARALARAPLSDVLTTWQGLGYNRRAKFLHGAAKAIVADHGGRVPRDVTELEELPGIGPYTARAIAAFAYNENVVFVETNIRTAIIHHFYPRNTKVTDSDVLAVLLEVLPKGRAREWYAALMDYGASLKRRGVRVNARSTSYAKQSTFKGSEREARGAILRTLAESSCTEGLLVRLLGPKRKEQARRALAALLAEGMVERNAREFRLPGSRRVSKGRSGGR